MSPSTSATVIVVPMPEVASSVRARSYTLLFASWISCTTRCSSEGPYRSACCSDVAARCEAISPACAPPMPSAIANSGGSQT